MKKIKALVLREDSFKIEEVEDPLPRENEVRVKISTAALNHRDQWIRDGQYAKIQLPAILGSDGSGIVESAGSDAVKSWLGKEVLLNPNINWGSNDRFQSKDSQILGMPSQGTLAEYVVVN